MNFVFSTLSESRLAKSQSLILASSEFILDDMECKGPPKDFKELVSVVSSAYEITENMEVA